MGLIKVEITDDHIKLVRQLRFHKFGDHLMSGVREVDELDPTPSPYGGDSVIDDMGLVIYGPPKDFDPVESEGFEWTKEQLEHLKKLEEEVPLALDIVLQTGKFETGHYKTKHYERNWKKYTPKG